MRKSKVAGAAAESEAMAAAGAEGSSRAEGAGEVADSSETAYDPPTVEVVSADVVGSSVSLMSSGGGSGGGGGGGTTSPSLGTENNPYVLTEGKSKAVSSSDTWFKCTISGTMDYSVRSTKKCMAYILEGNLLFGKNVLETWEGVTSHSGHYIGYGSKTYYIHLVCDVKSSFTCEMDQHQDARKLPKGGQWIPSKNSGLVNMNEVREGEVFFPADRIEYFIEMVECDEYLEWLDKVITAVETVVTVAMWFGEAAVAKGAEEAAKAFLSEQYKWVLESLIQVPFSKSLKEITIATAKKHSCYDESKPYGSRASKGLHISRVHALGVYYWPMEPWIDEVVAGPAGSMGTIEAFS